jgi:hypothetical protein
VLADDYDTKPISKMTAEEAQAARADAKAESDRMTPEAKAAVKRGMARKRPEELTAMESLLVGDSTMPLTDCEKQKYAGEKRGPTHPILCKSDPTKAVKIPQQW